MRKRIIIAAAFTACLALWAAVWPQTEVVEETLAPPQTPAVTAPEPIVAEVKLETEIDLPAEKEKAMTPQPEPLYETTNEREPAPMEASAAPEVQPTSEPELVAEAMYESVPEQAAEPSSTQETIESQSGDMVYVEGFGWIESQEPNHVEYAEDMYENGNKIGSMG